MNNASAWLNGAATRIFNSSSCLSSHSIGPPGALYVAANQEIVRYFLNGSSEDILISGLKGVTDIAVDYHDQMVSEYSTLHLCYCCKTS